MRNVVIKEDKRLFTECTDEAVECWCQDQHCTTRCAAFSQAVMGTPDQTHDLVAVCGAMPQMMPIGVIEEGKVAVVPPRGPTIVRG